MKQRVRQGKGSVRCCCCCSVRKDRCIKKVAMGGDLITRVKRGICLEKIGYTRFRVAACRGGFICGAPYLSLAQNLSKPSAVDLKRPQIHGGILTCPQQLPPGIRLSSS